MSTPLTVAPRFARGVLSECRDLEHDSAFEIVFKIPALAQHDSPAEWPATRPESDELAHVLVANRRNRCHRRSGLARSSPCVFVDSVPSC